MAESLITVEVVCALPDRQRLVRMEVPAGTTLRQAVLMAGLAEAFPDLDLAAAPLGIFGKAVQGAEARQAEAGDRIEVYRPLVADPKEVRKARAARAARAAQARGEGRGD
ncbi:RnfH family protein [Pseudomonas otitidis]|uniref:RnfH family protein n=1 Tax=Metapseudomonas otitidis TaxID=319939 RepID=UPI002E7B4793|nr:RnfH family protein [Pseudomonas otitidis]MEE1894319.1 RnfH family protein [Pseudomonas otitidis]